MNVPVFMYHRICATADRCRSSDFVVREPVFRRQLAYLKARGYSTPPIAGGLAPAPNARNVLLTFDDGYLDNYSLAMPLLIEHGFRATVFVVTDPKRRLNFWDANGPTGGAALMGPQHLRTLVHIGCEVGSHSVTHRHLDTLSDADALSELRDSKASLEDTLGASVRWFAYPYGSVSPRLKELVRMAGYRAAFAVNSGPFDTHDDHLEIRRVLVGNYAADHYMFAKLSGLEKAARSCSSLVRELFAPAPTPTPRVA